MKRFRFSLAAVLTVRAAAEEAALEAYGRAVREVNIAEAHLNRSHQERAQLLASVESSRAHAFAGTTQVAFQTALARSLELLNKARDVVLQAQRAREEKLAEFLEARRQADILRHLETRQQLKHLEAMRKAEETEVEELALAARHRLQTP